VSAVPRPDGSVTVVGAGDVGTAIDGEEEPRTLSRLDGQNAVSMLVRKQSGTNTVQVIDRVKAKVAEIQRTGPPDMRIDAVVIELDHRGRVLRVEQIENAIEDE